ncbi:MAG: hypothetical protein GQ574_02565 [Crocinitomix sp.]|nr:hypothetical protein [Crocinitomix sp.]
MLKSIYFLLFFTVIAFTTQSCKKEVAIDPTIEKYFGEWAFTKTQHRTSWEYIADSTVSSSYVSTFDMETNWEKTGKVSMGTQIKELFIQWETNSTIGYYATVKNDVGHLSCNTGCENIPYAEMGAGESSAHEITDTTFNLDLGFTEGMSSSSHWYITGVKM